MADIAARLGVSRQLVSIALRGLPGASVVRSAGDIGIALAVEHLVGLGHRRIAYVHCGAMPASRRRYPWSTPGSSSAAAPAARPAADSPAARRIDRGALLLAYG
jgi:DNA-binding LacI/PurR family transcriptional regulator